MQFHWTTNKFENDQYFLVKYLQMQFQPNTYIPTRVREWKLNFLDISSVSVKLMDVPCIASNQ
jgi:hypothetical protein